MPPRGGPPCKRHTWSGQSFSVKRPSVADSVRPASGRTWSLSSV